MMLQSLVIERRFGQAEAIDGSPLDGEEVGVVGLVSGVGRESELLGGQGMDDAGLEPGGGDGALDREVVVAGAFGGDDEVAEIMIGRGLADASDEVIEIRSGVQDVGWSNEDVTIEISEHPFGFGFGAIDGDDTEVLGPDFLDPGMDGPRGLRACYEP
jgi:hypothetical protein